MCGLRQEMAAKETRDFCPPLRVEMRCVASSPARPKEERCARTTSGLVPGAMRSM